MTKTLSIEIKAEKEEELETLLNNVFKEITEGKKYHNYDVESNCTIGGEWLEVFGDKCKGKYKWLRELN